MTNDDATPRGNNRTFLLLIYGVAVILALVGIALLAWGYWIGWLALAFAVVQAVGGLREQRKLRNGT